MDQWNYNAYMQNNYQSYYNYAQPTQPGFTANTSSDKPKTPPPPGIEANKAELSLNAYTSSMDCMWTNTNSTQASAYSGAYPYTSTNACYPQQQMFRGANAQQSTYCNYMGYPQSAYPMHPAQNQSNNWNGHNASHYSLWYPSGYLGSNQPRNCFNPGAQNDFKSAPLIPSTDISKEAIQQPPASLQAKSANEQWSDELKDYVQRAFCSIDTSEEKDQMERILKEKLEYIFRNNIKIDWKTENIPTIPSRAISAFRTAFLASKNNSMNVVRPTQLPRPRGFNSIGPARGSFTRLPVGLLTRGGMNAFSAAKTNTSDKSKPSLVLKSSSPSLASKHLKSWQHKRAYESRSPSRSSISSRSFSPSSSSSTSRRHRSRSSSRSGRNSILSHQSTKGRKNRRRKKRGGAASKNSTPNVESQSARGRGRGGLRGKRSTACVMNTFVETESRLSQRASRFKDHLIESPRSFGSIGRTTSQLLMTYATDERDDLAMDFGGCQIIGTMQEIEKQYLRLTRAPEPSEVRPVSILKQSLEHVKTKLLGNKDYRWACEQFKSIRQDLTVQVIQDDFTVLVYETHADAALEAGDFEEFHQCQSQLLRLHKDGLGTPRLLEFTAYRLLYYIFTLDILGINTIMAGLRSAHKQNICIKFALKVRSAWSLNNYQRFFRLVCLEDDENGPPLGCKHVINWFIDRERKEAIKIMFKVYRPNLSLSFVANSVGFPSVDLCKEFICAQFSIVGDVLMPFEKMDCKSIWNAICQQNS